MRHGPSQRQEMVKKLLQSHKKSSFMMIPMSIIKLFFIPTVPLEVLGFLKGKFLVD